MSHVGSVMKICPNCGRDVEVDVDREVCPECGSHVPVPPHERHAPHPPPPHPHGAVPLHIAGIGRRLDIIIGKLFESPKKKEMESHTLMIRKIDEIAQKLPQSPNQGEHELILEKLDQIVSELQELKKMLKIKHNSE